MKGKLIVVEGIDKSGKATQAKMLYEYLNSDDVDCIFCSEPSPKNPIGRMIRDFLNRKIEIDSGKAVTLLYSADRYENLKKIVLPALESGKNVVMERYFYSTYVYQSVLYGADKKWIKQIHEFVRKPDITILIDIPAEESIRRAGKNADRHEKLEKMEKVRDGYLEIAKEENFFVIDGNRPIDAVFEDVKKVIEENL